MDIICRPDKPSKYETSGRIFVCHTGLVYRLFWNKIKVKQGGTCFKQAAAYYNRRPPITTSGRIYNRQPPFTTGDHQFHTGGRLFGPCLCPKCETNVQFSHSTNLLYLCWCLIPQRRRHGASTYHECASEEKATFSQSLEIFLNTPMSSLRIKTYMCKHTPTYCSRTVLK